MSLAALGSQAGGCVGSGRGGFDLGQGRAPRFALRCASAKESPERVPRLQGHEEHLEESANYFVLGELATAAGLSSLSLVAGPIAYFAHEAAWHYYGPASARHANPLEATVHVPIPGAMEDDENGRTRFASVKMSRALAKTVTYEGVTAVSEFGVNYFFVRDLAAAAGLTAFSMVIAPFVY